MKIGARRLPQYLESHGKKRRRMQIRLVELQRAVEEVEDGLSAGYLPDRWASLLIARLERRAPFCMDAAVGNVR